MKVVLEIFKRFFLPHGEPKTLGIRRFTKGALPSAISFRPQSTRSAGGAQYASPSLPDAKRAPLLGPSSFRWSQRADSRMPPASAATRPAAAARSRARLRVGHRPARFTPRDLIGSNPRLPRMQKGPRCRDPPRFDGANERIRTADLRITSALLYQLSHVGISCG